MRRWMSRQCIYQINELFLRDRFNIVNCFNMIFCNRSGLKGVMNFVLNYTYKNKMYFQADWDQAIMFRK